jgi:hypothetical protein
MILLINGILLTYLLQSNWDNNNVEGETSEAQKITRLGARPTSYSSI